MPPIGHPNWIYQLKHDGFRGILYVDRVQAWLVSRKGKKFHQFNPLLKQVLRSLKGQRAILDGEIVVLGEKGRSNFFDLMARRGQPLYYAFDLVWLNGRDLRAQPFLERKRRLRSGAYNRQNRRQVNSPPSPLNPDAAASRSPLSFGQQTIKPFPASGSLRVADRLRKI